HVLAWVLADVAHDLALAYAADAAAAQKQPAVGPLGARLTQWQVCFFNVYVAYQPDNTDRKLYEGRRPGLLARRTGDKFIAEAFGVSVPPAAHVLRQPEGRAPQRIWQPMPDAHVKSLEEWLAKNVPANARLHQSLDPLSLKAPAAAPARGAPAGTQPTSITTGRSR
ncbi:MAG TPA: hypothetical protein VML55_04730, partial [Planctomycetaceae bacterium]|nr:hypothetical protein [Planctomycetaceae bacterium]